MDFVSQLLTIVMVVTASHPIGEMWKVALGKKKFSLATAGAFLLTHYLFGSLLIFSMDLTKAIGRGQGSEIFLSTDAMAYMPLIALVICWFTHQVRWHNQPADQASSLEHF